MWWGGSRDMGRGREMRAQPPGCAGIFQEQESLRLSMNKSWSLGCPSNTAVGKLWKLAGSERWQLGIWNRRDSQWRAQRGAAVGRAAPAQVKEPCAATGGTAVGGEWDTLALRAASQGGWQDGGWRCLIAAAEAVNPAPDWWREEGRNRARHQQW